MASTFTVAKTAMFYMKPIYFIGFRMSIAGLLLLTYLYLFKREKWQFSRKDLKLLLSILFFHIYCAYILESWALQYLTSAKTCLLYSLSPFITALIAYQIHNQRLSKQKWIALLVGFCAMLPILFDQSPQEKLWSTGSFLSIPEMVLILAIVSSSFGWITMKELTVGRGYSPLLVNGIGMLGGGILAFITAIVFEGSSIFMYSMPEDLAGKLLLPHFGWHATCIIMAIATMVYLIIVANIIGYNLYSYLLSRYSPTFLSFAGFITPFFASIIGWIFLSESLSVPFCVSLVLTMISLFIFYKQEVT